MDIFLGRITQQAMNYAIRSGIAITATYAIKQSSRLLKTVEGDERQELQELQQRLSSKIKILSPAIDMIELIAARGNTSLESAVTLTKSLRREIRSLGQRIALAAQAEEEAIASRKQLGHAKECAQNLQLISKDINHLIQQIEDAVPFINLAITASGANLTSSLSSTVSPSRLLQASTFLTAGDSQYSMSSASMVQIGPSFTLSLYMLFQGHLRSQSEEDLRHTTWKEVIHKASVKLFRVPLDDADEDSDFRISLQNPPQILRKTEEYAYQLVIVEDFEDDRVHTFEDDEQPGPFCGVSLAGIRETVPVHQISKIFYADTGKILSIGGDSDTSNPVLLLKRDVNAQPPQRWTMDDFGDNTSVGSDEFDHANEPLPDSTSLPSNAPPKKNGAVDPPTGAEKWSLPQNLDPEWMAFEVYTEAEGSESEDEEEPTDLGKSSRSAVSPSPADLAEDVSRLSVGSGNQVKSPEKPVVAIEPIWTSQLPPIQTSLSLLEMLLRLLSLQQFQQAPHLSISDELLNFFLSEAASTGAASNDVQERRRLREEARRHVGFDPYDESPVKLRGEEYQRQAPHEYTAWDDSGQSIGQRDGQVHDSPYESSFHVGVRTRSMRSREMTPQSPWSLHSSTGGAPNPAASPSPAGTPPLRSRMTTVAAHAAKGFKAQRRGSPLARPSTAISDEGIGTSPGYR